MFTFGIWQKLRWGENELERNDVGFLSPFLRYQEVRDVKGKKLGKFYFALLVYHLAIYDKGEIFILLWWKLGSYSKMSFPRFFSVLGWWKWWDGRGFKSLKFFTFSANEFSYLKKLKPFSPFLLFFIIWRCITWSQGIKFCRGKLSWRFFLLNKVLFYV